MLNPKSPIPLYHQLSELLQERIRSGIYGPGEMIPSEPQLAKQYAIGRPTVRQAMDLLVQKGLIHRRRGAGTFVKEPSPRVDLFSLAGTTQAFSTQGISAETRIISPMKKDRVNGDVGNPFHGKEAYSMSRLTLVEESAVLLEEIFLDTELFAGIDAVDFSTRSLSRVVSEQYYLSPENATQEFKVETPGPERAKILGISSQKQVLSVRRELHFPDAPHALFSNLFCLTDRFAFSQIIQGNG